MNPIKRLRNILRFQTKEFKDFQEMLLQRFGISNFLLATTEGLPISGTFQAVDEIAAELPELIKNLTKVETSESYQIITSKTVYTVFQVTEDILMFTKGNKYLRREEIEKLKGAVLSELKL